VKHQYFGDVNDYRKYGLLRALQSSGDLALSVAWMATPDDGSTDGSLRRYLEDESRWAAHDPELYDFLRTRLSDSRRPDLSVIEASEILPRAHYYSATVPDDIAGRRVWSAGLLEATRDADLVFLDPDNGLEIASKPMGRKGSSKYLAWAEVDALAATGKSLVIYQHFTREPRDQFIHRIGGLVRQHSNAAFLEAFRTPHVLFLVAGQRRHKQVLARAVSQVERNWAGQLDAVGLSSG
jgi:hypothetical protein